MSEPLPDTVTRAQIAVDDLEMVTDALAARAQPFRGATRSTGLVQAKREALAERIRESARELYRAALAVETGLDVSAGDYVTQVGLHLDLDSARELYRAALAVETALDVSAPPASRRSGRGAS